MLSSQPVISELNEIADQCFREAVTLREYQRSREVLTLQGGQGWIIYKTMQGRTSAEEVIVLGVWRWSLFSLCSERRGHHPWCMEMVSFQPVFRELKEITDQHSKEKIRKLCKNIGKDFITSHHAMCIEMVSFQPVFRELNEVAEASLFQRSPYFSRKPGGLYKKNKGLTSWEEVIILGVWFAQSSTLLHELSLIQE